MADRKKVTRRETPVKAVPSLKNSPKTLHEFFFGVAQKPVYCPVCHAPLELIKEKLVGTTDALWVCSDCGWKW